LKAQEFFEVMKSLRTIAALALLAIGIAAAPSPSPTPITLVWDYPAEEVTEDLTFNLYTSIDAQLPPEQWTLIKTVPGTARQVTIEVTPGRAFYYVTARNFWSESAPSNTASTPPVPRNDIKAQVRKGP
jgi:hypothetical protein